MTITGYVFLKGCVSVTISYLFPLTDKRKSQIYKVRLFYLEFGYIKIQYEHRETIRQNRTVFS